MGAQLVYVKSSEAKTFLFESKKWAVGHPESTMPLDDIAISVD